MNIVIYHDHCADGFGAAYAAWLKLGDAAQFKPMSYGAVNSPQDFLDKVTLAPWEASIYILDFSFPQPVMEWLWKSCPRVVWLDHHDTSFPIVGREPGQYLSECDPAFRGSDHEIVLDKGGSGALLAWEYFHPGTEVPELIQHIDDRDRWQFKLEGSKEIHAALASYRPWTFKQWRPFLSNTYWDNKTQVELAIEEGTAILRAHNQHVQSVLKHARECLITLEGEGLACNAPPFLASDLGHELANKSGTFGLVWHLDRDLKVRCSLRSNGEYNVSSIAKRFGGGGHRNAAGFETDIDTLMGWLR